MANIGKAAEEAEGSPDHVTVDTIDFHHPYTPYDIQETFMSTVYQVLEEGKVGILESPTGTVSRHLIHVIIILNLLLSLRASLLRNSALYLYFLFIGQVFESNMRISDLVTRPQTENVRGRP
jgi:hypothetical protein